MESEYHQTEAIWMFFMVCLISDLVNTSRLVHFYLIKKKKKKATQFNWQEEKKEERHKHSQLGDFDVFHCCLKIWFIIIIIIITIIRLRRVYVRRSVRGLE